MAAAERLEAIGVSVTLADARFAKPFDQALVKQLAREHEALLLVEDAAIGGFCSHVIQHLVMQPWLPEKLVIRALHLPDRFQDQDSPAQLYAEAGLDQNGIVSAALDMVTPRPLRRRSGVLGGVLIYIVPHYVLDAELVGWLTRHFAELRIYRAVDAQFRQVVIFGRKVRQRDQVSDSVKATRALLLQIGQGDAEAEELPVEWPFLPYTVPATAEPEHFYRVTMEPEQFADEVGRLQGLWPTLDTHLGAAQQSLRPPARGLSHWHLALALAAGAISGVVKSKTGRVLVVKGDTHKEKTLQTEYTERDDGTVAETRILTDKFVPVIRAWDMTPGSSTCGEVLTIR